MKVFEESDPNLDRSIYNNLHIFKRTISATDTTGVIAYNMYYKNNPHATN